MEFCEISICIIICYYILKLLTKLVRIFAILTAEYSSLSIQDQRDRIYYKLKLRKIGFYKNNKNNKK